MDGVMTLNPEIVDSVFATHANLFVMPLKNVLNVLLRAMPQERMKRLEELVTLVSQRQRLESMSMDMNGEPAERVQGSGFTRIPPPLGMQEIKALAELHGLSAAEIKEWSSLRIILNSFGWLGRRVGDYSVPESSIIFAVFRAEEGTPERNQLGLVGRSGMVPFRGTRLEQKWGKFWQTRFLQAISATMAENRADFEKLLRGIDDRADEEVGNSMAAS
jgi:hypothetical protein